MTCIKRCWCWLVPSPPPTSPPTSFMLSDVMDFPDCSVGEGRSDKETKWKGSKARNIGGGFKQFYHGVDGKRNGVGVILKEEYNKSVVEVKRVSDRVINVKLEVEGVMINVISAYAPQVGCEMEEKERFWSELDEVVDVVPRNEQLVIGADFNGHVGEGNRVDEEVMGRYGFKERNVEGQMVVEFARRMELAVVNTYFKKKEEHRVTYKSGERCTQVDYVLCRRCNLKEIGDCKVLARDSVARQHRLLVCRMVLEVKKKRRRVRTERRIRWWKLKEEDCSVRFREEVRHGLGGGEEVLDDWETTAGVMREAAKKKVLGVTSGNRKQDKETWWWNEEVQESIRGKRLAKQKWDQQSDEKSWQEYKEMRQQVKRDAAKAKEKANKELYERLDTKEGEKDLYRLARQRDRAGKDVLQCCKDVQTCSNYRGIKLIIIYPVAVRDWAGGPKCRMHTETFVFDILRRLAAQFSTQTL
ncbi:hypothetical protein HF521_008964 [Silurus meridionalis]|uniref:Craniofacial development protein 2-like n=1 Tax=Silurus meridionalis TaxID=175797 RepID=A0A8T0BS10_SILME|nr:hypothetical protein HF521_008964 [Silurus meridionalis]